MDWRSMLVLLLLGTETRTDGCRSAVERALSCEDDTVPSVVRRMGAECLWCGGGVAGQVWRKTNRLGTRGGGVDLERLDSLTEGADVWCLRDSDSVGPNARGYACGLCTSSYVGQAADDQPAQPATRARLQIASARDLTAYNLTACNGRSRALSSTAARQRVRFDCRLCPIAHGNDRDGKRSKLQ